MGLSVVHLSPLGSQTSFAGGAATRIENVADWAAISQKYRALVGDAEETGSTKDSIEGDTTSNAAEQPQAAAQPVANNVNAV